MRSLISFFVKHHIWSNVIIILVALAGLAALMGMKKSYFPEPRIDLISISVAYPGASPEEVEEGITLKIEDALKGIPGIEEVTSSSRENSASVSVVIEKGYDDDELLSDVKNAVDQIMAFPEKAERPKVFKRKPLDKTIYFALYGDVSLMELKKTAEKIEDDFLASGKLSQITILGLPELELSIEIKEDQLLRYGLTFEDISNAVSKNNRDISGGSIKTDSEELLIRSRAKSVTDYGIAEIVIRADASGNLIKVKDVADVELKFADVPSESIYNGKASVAINIYKLPDEDISEITDFTKAYMDDFNARYEDMQMDVVSDRSTGLQQRIDLLTSNGIVGLVLVVITLGLFLNLRVSLWVAMGIPVSFLGMILIAYFCNVTINQISLFGMILVIGILVDDGIVIAENIYAHLERGETPVKAAVNGTMEVFSSVFASVLTTIIAFSAFFFIEGRIGEFMKEMAIVVIACLAFSLVEASIVLPAHLIVLKKNPKLVSAFSIIADKIAKKSGLSRLRFLLDKAINYWRITVYGSILRFALTYRWQMLVLPIIFVGLTLALLKSGKIAMGFFPNIETNSLISDIEMKSGSRRSETMAYMQKVEKAIWEVNDSLKNVREDSLDVITAVRLNLGKTYDGVTGEHAGMIEVRMLEAEDRNMKNYDVSKMIQDRLGELPSNVEKFSLGARTFGGSAVSVIFVSRDLKELEGAKEDFKEKLREISDLKDVLDNDEIGMREVDLQLKPKAYFLGLDHAAITEQVRTGFFGKETQRLQIGSDEVKVWVRYPKEDRGLISSLERMKIKTKMGEEFPLQEIVDYKIERGPVNIRHYNGQREVKVSADMRNPDGAVAPIMTKVNEELLPDILNKYPSVTTINSGQKREEEKMAASALPVMIIIVLSIYFLLVLTFRSWTQPLMVISMIPLGIFGAYLGHYIESKTAVIMSTFGMIALTGVIINDAVVFLDKYNQNLKEGKKVWDAAYDAGLSRFRPIVLTSITTVAGLYPIIFEKSTQAQFLIPMAITMAYGVLFGTFFILVFFPSLIMIVSDIRLFFRAFFYIKKTVILSSLGISNEDYLAGITREESEPMVIEEEEHQYLKNEEGF